MMKKKWLLLLTSAVCALSLAACGDGNNGSGGGNDVPPPGPVQPVEKPATGISLSKTSVTLSVGGGSETITATVTPSDSTDEVSWKSGNTNIATVVNGKITAVAAGQTTVTATAGTKSATCTVTVNPAQADPKPATAISLDRTTLTLKVGKSETLTATVTPADSTDQVQWSSSSACVTVNNGVVTAVSEGTATITAQAGTVSETCLVTVTSDIATEQGYIWTENFKSRDEMPGYLTVNSANGGNAVINDDGMHVTTGQESGRKIFVEHTFDETLDGTFRVEMRVKAGNVSPFNDILFFLTETGDNVATIAIREGKYFNNHSGNVGNNGWAAMDEFAVEPDTWQDVELIFDTEKGTFDLYVSDGENSASMLKQPLRVPSNKDLIKRFRFGGDMNDMDLTLEYIKVSSVSGPELSVTQPDEGFEIDLNDPQSADTYTLDYSATSPVQDTLTYAVTCDKTSGFTIGDDKKTVTFTAMGEYKFTVTATDKYGSTSETVIVNVKGERIAPSITLVSEETASLQLQAQGGAKYTFNYTVAGSPAPTDSVEYDGNMTFATDAENDVIKSGTTVTFNMAGTYAFTIEANNGDTTVQKTVTITVVDKYAVPTDIAADKVLYNNSFDSDSNQATLIDGANASGSVEYTDNKMHITTTDKTGNYLFDLPFGQDLYGITSVEMKFSVTGVNFTNLMFFLPNGSSPHQEATACLCVEGGKVKYNSGSGWVDVKYGNLSVAVKYGVTYTLRAVLDFNNKAVHLYISGDDAVNLLNASNGNELVAPLALGGKEIYFGTFAFRVPAHAIATLRTGTNRDKIDYTIDDIKVNLLTPKLDVTEQSALVKNFTAAETYTFNYTAETGSEVRITCDDENAVINGNTASFTQAGHYLFKLSAANTVGASEKTIAVSVTTEDAYVDVDFTKDRSIDNFTAKTSSTYHGKYKFSDNGLQFTTKDVGNSYNRQIYWKYDMGETLTGYITTEIGFSVPASNNQIINFLFWFADMTATGNQPTNYMIGAGETLLLRNKETGSNWDTEAKYDGKVVHFINGEKYVLKFVHDFANNRDYIYLKGNRVDIGGVATDIEGGEIYLMSAAYRNENQPARVLSIGIDSQTNVDFTLTGVKVYKSSKPDVAP